MAASLLLNNECVSSFNSEAKDEVKEEKTLENVAQAPHSPLRTSAPPFPDRERQQLQFVLHNCFDKGFLSRSRGRGTHTPPAPCVPYAMSLLIVSFAFSPLLIYVSTHIHTHTHRGGAVEIGRIQVWCEYVQCRSTAVPALTFLMASSQPEMTWPTPS